MFWIYVFIYPLPYVHRPATNAARRNMYNKCGGDMRGRRGLMYYRELARAVLQVQYSSVAAVSLLGES